MKPRTMSFEEECRIREMHKNGTSKKALKKEFRIGFEKLEKVLNENKADVYLRRYGKLRIVEKMEHKENIFNGIIPEDCEVVL